MELKISMGFFLMILFCLSSINFSVLEKESDVLNVFINISFAISAVNGMAIAIIDTIPSM